MSCPTSWRLVSALLCGLTIVSAQYYHVPYQQQPADYYPQQDVYYQQQPQYGGYEQVHQQRYYRSVESEPTPTMPVVETTTQQMDMKNMTDVKAPKNNTGDMFPRDLDIIDDADVITLSDGTTELITDSPPTTVKATSSQETRDTSNKKAEDGTEGPLALEKLVSVNETDKLDNKTDDVKIVMKRQAPAMGPDMRPDMRAVPASIPQQAQVFQVPAQMHPGQDNQFRTFIIPGLVPGQPAFLLQQQLDPLTGLPIGAPPQVRFLPQAVGQQPMPPPVQMPPQLIPKPAAPPMPLPPSATTPAPSNNQSSTVQVNTMKTREAHGMMPQQMGAPMPAGSPPMPPPRPASAPAPAPAMRPSPPPAAGQQGPQQRPVSSPPQQQMSSPPKMMMAGPPPMTDKEREEQEEQAMAQARRQPPPPPPQPRQQPSGQGQQPPPSAPQGSMSGQPQMMHSVPPQMMTKPAQPNPVQQQQQPPAQPQPSQQVPIRSLPPPPSPQNQQSQRSVHDSGHPGHGNDMHGGGRMRREAVYPTKDAYESYVVNHYHDQYQESYPSYYTPAPSYTAPSYTTAYYTTTAKTYSSYSRY